jgi:hypothetical protein
VVLYNVYAMCILFWHFRRYVIIRHSYLTRGASMHGGCMGIAFAAPAASGCSRAGRGSGTPQHLVWRLWLSRRRLASSLRTQPPTPVPPPGDDPNFWLTLTHQADAKSISKKVKRMLLDLNLASEGGGEVRTRV